MALAALTDRDAADSLHSLSFGHFEVKGLVLVPPSHSGSDRTAVLLEE